MTLLTRQTLLHLTNRQQVISLHQPTQLAHQRHMFRYVPSQPPELGILLHEPLHVRHCLDPARTRRATGDGRVFGLIVGHVGRDGCAEITKVGKEVLGEEGVGRGGEDDVL